ncbi:MAG TPA: ABC transporter substrate-binding protein [Chloroflexota bacterium]|nr:ABC transporter substrate-binding protein [Chloroflexota bacterium]
MVPERERGAFFFEVGAAMVSVMRIFTLLAALIASGLVARSGTTVASGPAVIRIGAVFPLRGAMRPAALEEYRGVEIARDLVNGQGGVLGRRIVLAVKDFEDPGTAPLVMQNFQAQGIRTVIGAFSSALSIPAGAAAGQRGMLYWEAGAEADRLTGQGYRTVFRVGASGGDLGTNSAYFAATQLAPRLGKRPQQVRVSVVNAIDDYALSVSDAAVREAALFHMPIVSRSQYDPSNPSWKPVIAALRRAHPDVIILASHVYDGVAFRRAMLRANLHVGALVGSTMAQCGPDFGKLLGKDAVGVFASDRPDGMGGFGQRGLDAGARALYARVAAAWKRETGQPQPSEEALAGFSAAWVLFHDVLPAAARHGSLDPAAVGDAARALNLPQGSLPNGAGVRFDTTRQHLGENTRAAAVIWQWQAVRHSVVVWPQIYATGMIKMVPLPR